MRRGEDGAGAYRPGTCVRDYRVEVLRKNSSVAKGEQFLFDDAGTSSTSPTGPVAGACASNSLVVNLQNTVSLFNRFGAKVLGKGRGERVPMKNRPLARTQYFQDVIAAFEGGGVRGIAYGGACAAATRNGIRIRAAVGTSVGSIAAALVAAGMDGEGINQTIRDLPLSRFLSRPAKPKGALGRTLVKAASVIPGALSEAVAYGQWAQGRYSSEPIQTWVNETLQGVLGTREPVVRFKHLPYPLAIVTADLKRQDERVWSSAKDSEASVAFAVRCSCSIPFFFQPVEHEGSLLVDGGILANLPTHIAKEFNELNHLPVIAFRLVGTEIPDGSPKTGLQMIQPLVNTIISGGTNIQLGLVGPCQPVEIETGEVSSTDFNLSNLDTDLLIRNGAAAVDDLVQNELLAVSNSGFLSERLRSGIRGNVLEQTMIEIANAHSELLIMGGDLSWVGDLAAVLLLKSFQGVKISILYDRHVDSNKLKMLAAIGCDVSYSSESLGVYGSIVDPSEQSGRMVLVDRGEGRLSGTVMHASTDYGLIGILRDRFLSIRETTNPEVAKLEASFVPVDHTIVEQALRKYVRQYSECTISIEPVKPETTLPLTRWLESAKLRRVHHLSAVFEHSKLNLYESAIVPKSGWFSGPPVVEELNGRLILIDGAHRFYHAIMEGIPQVQSIVIRGVKEAPPAKILQDWQQALPLPERLESEKRYQNFNKDVYRHIAQAWEQLPILLKSQLNNH